MLDERARTYIMNDQIQENYSAQINSVKGVKKEDRVRIETEKKDDSEKEETHDENPLANVKSVKIIDSKQQESGNKPRSQLLKKEYKLP